MEQTQISKKLSQKELLESLRESQILSAAELARAAAWQSEDDGLALANALVEAGILTAFQMAAVCHNRHGDLRIGNYDVLDKLGAGGMGTVYKARHRRMKRVVALKVLARELEKDENFVQRFQREVETIARLSHPNIVMAYDADEAEVGHFLVMEFVNGPDLATLVQKHGPLGPAASVDCILQAARGLAYVHAQGMIHRDIKPANLLRDATGAVKVTDLGLARFNKVGASRSASSLTQAGGILGTADYMSPEQAVDSTAIDHRADIYSLGGTLHYLLLGQPPYQAQTLMGALLQHREAPIPSLTTGRKDVPPSLDQIFRRMMAKSVADRYQSITEVVEALEAIQSSLGAGVPMPLLGVAPVDFSETAVGPNLETNQAAAPAVSSQTVDLKPPSTAGGVALKVLLVEPSRTQSSIIRKYLHAQNIPQVVAAASGQEALKAFKANRPDVIVSALHLPDMTGVELAKQVRAANQGTAPGFVLISSEAESAEAGTLSKCGQTVLLHKPFTPEQLVEALNTVSKPSTEKPGTPESLQVKSPSTVRRAALRVLIVDDSAPARLHVQYVLEGLGFGNFVAAADGAQAVAALAREKFALIVTDYHMPFMDGRGLVGYLKQNPATASVPIVMVTTETDPGKLEAVRRLGVAAVCDKKFPPEVVRGIVDKLF